MTSSEVAIRCIYEDEYLFVIDKPAGMSVHNDEDSVLSVFSKKKLFPVHRLDKETSGVLVLAKDKKSATEVQEAFANKRVLKNYIAIVFGDHSNIKQSGKWIDKLGVKPGGLKNPRGAKPFVEAETSYQILETNPYFTKLNLSPLTGKTHQLRKHCCIKLSSIVGDGRYAKPASNKRIEKIYSHSRMFLHAYELSLKLGSETLEFRAELPKEFSDLFPQDS